MKELQDINGLYNELREIITSARQNAVRSVDLSRVQMYWSLSMKEESARFFSIQRQR